jgi:cell division septation protein DedD
MTERETESRRSKSRARGPALTRWVYGSLLVAIGACIGIVIGSVSDTPRIFLDRMRGPVETVDLPAAAPTAAETPPLEAFDELQGAAPAKPELAKPEPAKPEPKRAVAKAPAAPAQPAAPIARAPTPAPAPQVSSPPPPAPAPARSAEEIVRALEKKTDAASKGGVVQVLSLAEKKQADALVAKLKTQGFDPYATPMPDKSGRYRVRVRPSSGQSPAELELRLKALGLKTWATAE